MTGFTKLWAEILSSSIWNEGDKVRLVWITMLAAMGPDYMVRASIGGLAHLARVSREDCEKALQVLSSPDPDSRSKEFDGRRIQQQDGGFLILNGGKYRDARNHDERKVYMADYMRDYRRKQSVNKRKPRVNKSEQSKPPLAQAEAEAEAEARKRAAGAAGSVPAKAPRPRSPIFDALVSCEGLDPFRLPKEFGGRFANAQAKIKSLSPEVTPEMVARRWENMRLIMAHFNSFTANALANNWHLLTEDHRVQFLAKPRNGSGTPARKFTPDLPDPDGPKPEGWSDSNWIDYQNR